MTGDITDNIDGSPVARHGDKTACGAMLISSQMLTYTDDESDSGGKSAGSAASSTAAQSFKSTAQEHEDCDHDQHLILEDQDGQPLEGIPYRLTDARNAIIDGTTGADGKTKIVAGNSGETLDCDIAKETNA